MILIADDSKRKRSTELRYKLMSLGLPCIMVDQDHIRKHPEALLVMTFVSSEDKLNLIAVKCGRIPLLVVNESGSRIYNKDVTFYDDSIYKSYEEFILAYLNEKLGIVIDDHTYGRITLGERSVYMGPSSFRLTVCERMILMLVMLCHGKWVSEESIRKACFSSSAKRNTTRVSVHICNINKKSKNVFKWPIITCKRGVGYMLDPCV